MDEDEYAIAVQIKHPDSASVMLRLSWEEEPDWNAVVEETNRLAKQALAISLGLREESGD